MDFRHSKYLIALAGLFLSAFAFAGSYTETCPNVTVPCERSGWDIGFEGSWMKPMNHDLGFQEETNPGTEDLPSVTHYIKPKYHFGWRVIGSYHFGYGNDVTVHYSRFRDKRSQLATGIFSPQNEEGPSETVEALGAARWKYDSFVAEFGQKIKLSSQTGIRIHAGVEYAKIFQRLSTSVGGGDFLEVIFDDSAPNFKRSEFKGFGGRFGLDMWHRITDRFYVVAHGATGILAGNMNLAVRTGEPFLVVDEDSPNTDFDVHQEFQAFVPTYEARGGVVYKHHTSNGKLMAELGYQLHGYASAVIHGQDGVYKFDDDRNHVSGYGFHGPYLTLKYFAMS